MVPTLRPSSLRGKRAAAEPEEVQKCMSAKVQRSSFGVPSLHFCTSALLHSCILELVCRPGRDTDFQSWNRWRFPLGRWDCMSTEWSRGVVEHGLVSSESRPFSRVGNPRACECQSSERYQLMCQHQIFIRIRGSARLTIPSSSCILIMTEDDRT